MKNKKNLIRLLALMLAAVMVMAVFAACGGSSKSKKDDDDDDDDESTAAPGSALFNPEDESGANVPGFLGGNSGSSSGSSFNPDSGILGGNGGSGSSGNSGSSGSSFNPGSGILGGSGGTELTGSDAEAALIGEWRTELSVENLAKEMLDEYGQMGISFKNINLTVILRFDNDGRYNASLEPQSAERAMRQIYQQMLPYLKDMLREALAQELNKPASTISDSDIFAYFRQSGMQVSSWDDVFDLFMQQSDFSDEMFGEMSTSGSYEVEGNMIRMDGFTDEFSDNDGWIPYTITRSRLTLYAGTNDLPAELAGFMPMVFTR